MGIVSSPTFRLSFEHGRLHPTFVQFVLLTFYFLVASEDSTIHESNECHECSMRMPSFVDRSVFGCGRRPRWGICESSSVPPSPRLPLPLVAPTKFVFVLLFTPCLAWIRKQPTPADGRVIRDGGSTCKPLKPCDLAPMPQPESAASTAPRVEGRGLRKSFSVDFYQSSGWKARFDRPASFVDLNSIRARRRHVGGVAIHCRF